MALRQQTHRQPLGKLSSTICVELERSGRIGIEK